MGGAGDADLEGPAPGADLLVVEVRPWTSVLEPRLPELEEEGAACTSPRENRGDGILASRRHHT